MGGLYDYGGGTVTGHWETFIQYLNIFLLGCSAIGESYQEGNLSCWIFDIIYEV